MFNLLSGEFYKWKKSKSFKICLLAAIAMGLLIYNMLMLAAEIQSGQMENGSAGITVSGEAMESGQSILDEIGILGVVEEVVSGGFGTFFTVIFTCIWVLSEHSHGAIKNLAGKGESRTTIFLAKWISALAGVAIMNIIYYTAMLAAGFVTMGTDGVNAGFFQDFLSYAGMQLLFGVAVTGIVTFICEVTRNMAAGIAISVVMVMFSSVFTNVLDLLLQYFHLDVEASSFWILNVISECTIEALEDMKFVGRGILVALIWTAISLILGMVHFQKTDIK